jgi:organic radical activating enzyme
MKPLMLPNVEFYITNVCNFNCSGCNRFNNLNFSGRQKWDDYKSVYKKWADYLDLKKFTILGGEPMTNPDYLDWLEGVSQLWPDAIGSFLTNGHYLTADNHLLYNILKNSNQRITLNIGLHNELRATPMIEIVSKFLRGKITVTRVPENVRNIENFDFQWQQSYNQIRDQSWPDCNNIDEWDHLPEFIKQECQEIHKFSPDIIQNAIKGWKLVDENYVTVIIDYEDHFSQGSLLIGDNYKKITLHQSDPAAAHKNCNFVPGKCYHFIKGKLYKCGPVALFPEIDKKFNLNLSDTDHQLVHSYKPGDIEYQSLDEVTQFINNIDNQIDQCKFCPEQYLPKKIHAQHGKKTLVLVPSRK